MLHQTKKAMSNIFLVIFVGALLSLVFAGFILINTTSIMKIEKQIKTKQVESKVSSGALFSFMNFLQNQNEIDPNDVAAEPLLQSQINFLTRDNENAIVAGAEYYIDDSSVSPTYPIYGSGYLEDISNKIGLIPEDGYCEGGCLRIYSLGMPFGEKRTNFKFDDYYFFFPLSTTLSETQAISPTQNSIYAPNLNDIRLPNLNFTFR